MCKGRGGFTPETAGGLDFAAPAFPVRFPCKCKGFHSWAVGFLVFLGAWPGSLGSAIQFYWTCLSGTKLNGCSCSTYR